MVFSSRLGPTFGRSCPLACVCSVILLVATVGVGKAAIKAKAEASWFYDKDGPGNTIGFKGTGEYLLGWNQAIAGSDKDNKAAQSRKYSDGGLDRSAKAKDGGTEADAFSWMTVFPQYPSGFYPYNLHVKAYVIVGGIFDPGGSAIAQGQDPQEILSPGVAEATLWLYPGSSIFESRPDVDFARSSLELTAPLLSQPLAYIELQSVGGNVDATVDFASDDNLSFFDSFSALTPISSSYVEGVLEDSEELGTEDGLSSPLKLFSFSYDLTGATLPSDAAFGSSARSEASVIPEPASLMIWSLLAAIGISVGWYRRRRAA